ncbi:phospholipid-transporting ATPase IA isoform X4 [Zootermopsis nevadensis]|uniref:phospholipid-transporting ATPase IA isoform X4 n=2 Tax=Zootermopsis nevadensis TaxID=136037 RepID=UPI000B8E31EA|nr:phospholipid-transporting ATPase IA isoform X4 [Zootermopsis nevadensis]
MRSDNEQIELGNFKANYFDADTTDEDVETNSVVTEVIDETTTEHRIIFVNHLQPTRYCNNHISTAKYSALSFVPSFLFEQFRRYSNCFFLFIALLQQIPDVSPTGRYTTLVPLIFILSVSAIKEVVEDIKRHRADDEINHRKVEVLRDGHWLWVQWLNVAVGDIVKVHNNTFFPADLAILSSSEPQAICYIETSNLDGETNLKIRQAIPETARLLEIKDLTQFTGTLECELPNRHLYEFSGILKETNKQTLPLGPDQLLLRGAMLRNTSWVFGIVIYTGHETKLMKNSTSAPLKRSTVDKMTNRQILLLFIILIVLCLLSAVFSELWSTSHPNDWYIGINDLINANFGYNLLTFIILYNNLIPISLQVSLEVVRFVQAIFINMDTDMYHEESDTPAMARTSNLNEELGQVKYIFSDKTGTLTRNVMDFKKCSIADNIYTLEETPYETQLVKNLQSGHPTAPYIREFLILMSVCHTVIPEKAYDNEIHYHAASPDEQALVKGACQFGYVFDTRTPNHVEIDALGTRERYEILNVLEFTSTRKRMSVIVRNPDGQIKLYCKGADTVIYERLAPDGQLFREETLRHLENFATEGLRTLCCAVSDVSDDAYEEWKDTYYKASTSLQYRERKLEDAANLIENNLILLGATAIEDKLQDQVPETIAALIKADIHVWVLTGDKQETAINIGYSCKLIVHGMPLLIINEDSLDNTREVIARHSSEFGDQLRKQNEVALVIDGKTLKYALSCDVRRDFLDLCVSCNVVICCRVSPIQKAEVVELVTSHTKSVTLAIGDGANDVAMIQRAHVGIGISGVEGLQAACASDYSIAQLFTAAPPLAMGLFDKVCSAETMLKYPALYKPSQNADLFNVKVFWVWILNALGHSILLYWLPLLAAEKDVIWSNGREGGYLLLGDIVYSYVVVTVCLKAGLVTNAWTWLTHLAIWGSIATWFIVLVMYSNFWPSLPVGAVMLGMDRMMYTSPVFWLGLFLIPFASLIADITYKVVHATAFKSVTEMVRESEIRKADPGKVIMKETKHSPANSVINFLHLGSRIHPEINTVFSPLHALGQLSRYGFAFSQEEGGAVTQSEVIRAYNTNLPKPGGM